MGAADWRATLGQWPPQMWGALWGSHISYYCTGLWPHVCNHTWGCPAHYQKLLGGRWRSAANCFCGPWHSLQPTRFCTVPCNARFQLKLLPKHPPLFCSGIFSKTKEDDWACNVAIAQKRKRNNTSQSNPQQLGSRGQWINAPASCPLKNYFEVLSTNFFRAPVAHSCNQLNKIPVLDFLPFLSHPPYFLIVLPGIISPKLPVPWFRVSLCPWSSSNEVFHQLEQGFPTPRPRTGSSPRSDRNQTAHQEVSSGQASQASSAAPHRSPSLTLPPEPSLSAPPPAPVSGKIVFHETVVPKRLGTTELEKWWLFCSWYYDATLSSDCCGLKDTETS